jgi:hypothetical protein
MTESTPSRANPLLDKLKLKPSAVVATSIGELHLFSLKLLDVLRLGKSKRIEDPSADARFMRNLVHLIAFPTESLVDGEFEPAEPVLQQQQLAALSEVDLDRIAGSFLEHETFFYMSRVQERTVDAHGNPVSRFIDGSLIHPRLPAETSIRYLRRLIQMQSQSMVAKFLPKMAVAVGCRRFATFRRRSKVDVACSSGDVRAVHALKPAQSGRISRIPVLGQPLHFWLQCVVPSHR